MPTVPGKANYAKLVHEAQKTKSKFKKSQIEAYSKWQRKLGKKSSNLDKIDEDLRKIYKEIEAADKKKQEDHKMRQRFLKIIEGALKEIKTFKEVPVQGKLPDMPKNTIALGALLPIVAAILGYVVALKAQMAICEAMSKKDT